MKYKIMTPMLILSSSIMLIACGAGSSSSSTSSTSTSSSASIQGTIDGFGSVIVNGVHYESTGATFNIDDQDGIERDLRVGQVVTIEGSDDGTNGVARRIIYDADVRGPVTSVDLTARTLTILGQTIIVDEMTVFEGVTLDAITVDQMLEISGYRDGNGQLHASFITATDTGEAQVRGVISLLDTTAMVFNLGAQVVNYSSVVTLDLEDNGLSEGMLVEVEGSVDAGVLVANKIEQEDFHHHHKGDAKVKGFITALDLAAGTMTVNSMDVLLTENTRYEHGDASSLALNAVVKIEGKVNANGLFEARKVEFEARTKLEVEGPVTASGTETVTVMGVTARVDTRTRVRDERDDEIYFNLADVQSGDDVEMRLAIETDGSYRALRLERTDSENEIKITAPVDSIDVAAGSVNMLGVTVDVSAVSSLDLTTLVLDSYLEVKGSFDGTIIIATEAGEDHRFDDEHEGDHEEERNNH